MTITGKAILEEIGNMEKMNLERNIKKVLIIANLSGFLWKFELDDVALLQELGYEVHYASNINEKGYYFEPDKMQQKGICFHHVDIARSPYSLKSNKKALDQILEIIHAEKIDLIHCHTPVGGLLGRLASVKSKRKPKVIYTAHGFHFYKGAPVINNILYQTVERMLAHHTDALVLINREDYEAAQGMRLRKGGKVYKIPGTGVDLARFSPVSREEKEAARRRIGIKKDSFFILSVGELNLNKNHKTAICAVKKLLDGCILKRPVLYGICGDGFFRDDIKKFAEEEGLGETVRFFGYQCDIKEYYAAADVTVFPSLREGLGMVGLESMAMGIPVVAADNRGTREYMKNGRNGYVFEPKDVKGCAEGIQKVAEMALEERIKMSECCVQTTKKFSKEITHSIMREIYSNTTQV